jgi:hypothetical protein
LPNPTFSKFKPLELPNTFILIFPTINSARFKFKTIHNPMKLPSKVLNELPNTFILTFPTINSARFKFKTIPNPMKLPSKVLNSSKLKEDHKKISTVTIPLHKKHLEGTIFPMAQFMKASSIPITNFKVLLYQF